ncbi:MAG: membrane integrity-associated transporter subunit PqiC [Proteobacteria bacterium]|nr:membrane integrity-associated transporter subunit PqiC [Pseudomonadota bacterium]
MTRTKKLFRPWFSTPVLALIPALLLAGCSSIIDLPGGGEAPALYELRAYDGPGLTRRNWILFIEEPSVSGALSSDQVAVRLGQRRLEYLAGARWSDRTAQLLGRYFEESIENSGLATVVGAGTVEIAGDYRLKIDIRDFSADVSGGGRAVVNVRFGSLVLRSAPAEIVGRKQFEASAEARGRGAEAIIEAFNNALDQATAGLLAWLAEIPDTGGT